MMRLSGAVLCVAFLFAPFAVADTIYNSFGAGNSYSNTSGISIIGANQTNGAQSAAGSFSISSVTELASATFAITGDPVELELTADDSGHPAFPGTPLDSFAITPSNATGSTV